MKSGLIAITVPQIIRLPVIYQTSCSHSRNSFPCSSPGQALFPSLQNMEGIAHLGGEEAGIPAAELCFSTLRSFNQREDRPKKDKSTSKSKHLPERSVYTESARWPYKMLNNHNCPPSKGERSASQGYMARDIVPPGNCEPCHPGISSVTEQ